MLETPFEIEHLFVCLSWVCLTLTCVFFFRRGTYRAVPEFTNFIIYNTAIEWMTETYFYTFHIYHPIRHPTAVLYFYWYWTTRLIGETIQLLTIYALFARVLRVLPESRQKRRSIPLVSVVFLLMLTFANFAQSGWTDWNLTKRLEFIYENFVLIDCGLVLAAIVFLLIVAAPWNAPVKGILAGFAVDSSVRLLIYATGIYHPNAAMLWPLGRILMDAAESLGWYVWLVVIFRTPKSSSQDNIAYLPDLEFHRRHLRDWTSSIGGWCTV